MKKFVCLSVFSIFIYGNCLADTQCDGAPGKPHLNGGGFVATSAFVAPTVVVTKDASVCQGARVYGKAKVLELAVVGGNAEVYEKAEIKGNAHVIGMAKVFGKAKILDQANVFGKAIVKDEAMVSGSGGLSGNVVITKDRVLENGEVINFSNF